MPQRAQQQQAIVSFLPADQQANGPTLISCARKWIHHLHWLPNFCSNSQPRLQTADAEPDRPGPNSMMDASDNNNSTIATLDTNLLRPNQYPIRSGFILAAPHCKCPVARLRWVQPEQRRANESSIIIILILSLILIPRLADLANVSPIAGKWSASSHFAQRRDDGPKEAS